MSRKWRSESWLLYLWTTSVLQALNLGVNALSEVRYLTKNWRMEYNEERPHSSLGNLPSVIYA
ncbi:hypothetical protein CWC46_21560 [Prodigiosinella confusarubida]|uniref:Integrase catalytic domain-containing protein n=1 Tax=Serratia sp. (strain ATCC 39006) TaxID=104623 RepID=A0A2I5TPI9_SERS3|nr:hypothetical protein CWC46_21560 [Serratia sp. ATCC 39006]AUH06470.1 hypothetical protein Ser39006_021550 [Serratia sp. ATCC 39006]